MDERIQRLRHKLSDVPEAPGVYLHRDKVGAILYVGKARRLQSRLHSYFYGLDRHPPKTRALVARIHDFEVILAANEHESLVLENNLIKHHKPPYNILLRDDKTFPFLRLDVQSTWPRLVQTRKKRDDGALYFGPYTSGGQLFQLTSIVTRYFPLVKCAPTVFKTAKRPCNYFHIKRCLAPCTLPVDKEIYAKMIAAVIDLISGKNEELLERLGLEMQAASEKMEFETAARLRDQIQGVRALWKQRQAVFLGEGIDIDIIGSHWQGSSACFFVSSLRNGKFIGGEHFILHVQVLENDEGTDAVVQEADGRSALLESFLCQHYLKRVPPKFVLCPAITTCFSTAKKELVLGYLHSEVTDKMYVFAKQEEMKPHTLQHPVAWKEMSLRLKSLQTSSNVNAKERYLDYQRMDETARRAITELQKVLSLEEIPAWIECFDISTFQGVETVASQVVFRDGRPFKSGYRRYIMKETVEQDDFASLRETMRRRFKEEHRHEIPDLIIVDGGEPQVREVGWVLKSIGLESVALVGIAKARTESAFAQSKVSVSQERLVVPKKHNGALSPEENPDTIALKIGSSAYRLVTQIRDEAHRVAITLHRKRRDALQRQSVLHRIAGLGPKKRKRLLEIFTSLQDLVSVPAAELVEKAGLDLALALRIQAEVKAALG